MGCCQSRERSPYNSPPQQQPQNPRNDPVLQHDGSRAAINQPARSLSDASSARAAPKDRPNVPIRAPTPVASSPANVSFEPPPWTRNRLEKEREAFFDTRVSGNAEIWKGLRVVCEMVRRGEVEEAQGILDALNVNCPTGRIARDRGKHSHRGGVYDERGELYDIPAWVVSDPQDIMEDAEKDVGGDGAADDDQDGSVIAASRRKVEKGKSKEQDVGEMVTLRLRLSNTGSDVTVTVGMKEKISTIIDYVLEQIGPKRVRLMYLGKVLKERETLEQSAWKPGHVINALVYEGDANGPL